MWKRIGQGRKRGKLFSPINEGPLPKNIAISFRSATYREVVSDGNVILYRVYGGNAGKLGPYWTRVKPSGALQSKIDSALLSEWGNTIEGIVKIKVPKGVKFYEGSVAAQKTLTEHLIGGGNQVYFYKIRIDAGWIIK